MLYDDSGILEKYISRERVFDGLILHIDHVTNELPSGRQAKREVALHIGASAVLPVDRDGRVYLVRQYRAPIERVLTEIPAGKLDAPDEDRLLAAKRELREETGFVADSWELLTDTFTTPGFSSERISIYLARELHAYESRPDEDEYLNMISMPYAEALELVYRGEIADGKTQLALLLAQRLL